MTEVEVKARPRGRPNKGFDPELSLSAWRNLAGVGDQFTYYRGNLMADRQAMDRRGTKADTEATTAWTLYLLGEVRLFQRRVDWDRGVSEYIAVAVKDPAVTWHGGNPSILR